MNIKTINLMSESIKYNQTINTKLKQSLNKAMQPYKQS